MSNIKSCNNCATKVINNKRCQGKVNHLSVCPMYMKRGNLMRPFSSLPAARASLPLTSAQRKKVQGN